jgi:hypothetical protein
MIVSISNFFSGSGKLTLDPGTTRSILESMLAKTFDPAMMPLDKLDVGETARFIAEQSRKLRLAAIAADQISLLWMIECLYYEAYSLGRSQSGQATKPKIQRGLDN